MLFTYHWSDFCPAEKLRIITPLKDTEAKEGQEVVLNCEVNQEGAKAKWLKNDETLFESSKYVMVQRDNVFSLRIRDAQKGDEANYSINLTNQRGEQAKSSGRLTVKGQWSSVTVCRKSISLLHSPAMETSAFCFCIEHVSVLMLFRGESEDCGSSGGHRHSGEEDSQLLL